MLPRRRRPGSESENTSYVYRQDSNLNHLSVHPNTSAVDDYLDDDTEDYTEPQLIMTARDRTSEFVNTIQTLQGRIIVRAVSGQDPKKSKAIQSHSKFMLIAKNVGKNITSTYAKLEKLTLLAKRKSLFDDRTTEIQELTYIIKNDLGSLNKQIAQLQDVSKTQRNNSVGKHLQSHSSSVVLALQSKLATMSTDFKQILEIRTENLKRQKNRRDQFSQGGIPPPPNNANQGLLLQEEQASSSVNMESALVPQQRAQLQESLLYDDTDNYLVERAETMQNIESTVVELGGIFQQLATMVKEQEEMVERIDTNVGEAELNIEAAHAQIVKYFQSVTSNRWLMVKIFGVLIFFFMFFVILLA